MKTPRKQISHLYGFVVGYAFCAMMVALADTIFCFSRIRYTWCVLVGLVIVVIPFLLLLKRYSFQSVRIHLPDLLACGIVTALFLIKAAIPDVSWDTLNYHLYTQENFGVSNIFYHFLPARAFNSATLPLGDRMFYLFRTFLGYRLGTVLNLAVGWLVYFQVRDLFSRYFSHKQKNLNKWCNALFVLPVLMFDQWLFQINTYYIDLLSLPFFLQIIKMLLYDQKQEGVDLIVVIIMGVTCVSIKISNALIIAPLAFIYVIKFRKSLKLKPILLGMLVSFFSIFIYLYANYADTQNPVFPYMNDLFKSPYFITGASMNDICAFNSRFGPERSIEYITWPITSFLRPERCSDERFTSGRLISIAAALLVSIAHYTIKKLEMDKSSDAAKAPNRIDRLLEKPLLLMGLMIAVFYFVYLFFMQGYLRYIAILDVMGGVFIILIIYECFSMRYIWVRIIAVTLSILLALQVGYLLWHTRLNKEQLTSIRANIPHVFKDMKPGTPQTYFDQAEYWLILNYNAGHASLMNKKAPIIRPYTASFEDFGYEAPSAIKSRYKELLKWAKGKRGFVPVQFWETSDIEARIHAAGFEVVKVFEIEANFFPKPIRYYLYEIKTAEPLAKMQ